MCSCGKENCPDPESKNQDSITLISQCKTYLQDGQVDAAMQLLDSLEVTVSQDKAMTTEELSVRNIYLLGIMTILVVIVFALRRTHKRLVSATEEKVRMARDQSMISHVIRV